MRRKLILMGIVLLIIEFFLINQYTNSAYHMNVFQYFWGVHQITMEDKLFLKEHGPLIYASDNNSPPLRYYDSEMQQYKGIVIDYLRALSIELGTDIQFVPMVWEDALESLKNGETDMCDMYPSKERSEVYLFSDPVYYQRGIILVPRKNGTIQSAFDLSGKKIAIQRGDYAYEYLKNNVSDIQYVFGTDYEENLRRLLTEEVDAIVGDEPVISYFLNLYGLSEDYRIADEPLYELPSVLSLQIDDKRLQNIVNKGIYSINKKKIINKIQQKWFGISTPIDNDNSLTEFTIIAIGIAMIATSIVILILIWNLELKKAVDEQTRVLKISKDNLQTLLDGLHHIIVVISCDFNIHSANALFYNIFGTKEENGEFLYNLIPGITEETRQKWLIDYEESEHIIKGRIYLVMPYPVRYEDHKETMTMLMLEDVTDKKVNESRLLQDNKMSAVGQLATGVAHEIRNPLGLIRNYAYVLKLNKDDEKIFNQSLEVIEESVDKASSIIDNLLNFSRISDDSIRLVYLKPFIENIIQLNEKLMNKSHLKCNLVLEDVMIMIQEESLKHILLNLISNAIDAMTEGGHLTIWMKKDEKGVHIHVIDTGIGMIKETKERLYDPFFTTKDLGQGTGLGLYIAYNELNKIGGKIYVISKLEKGTTFKIQLKNNSEVSYAK